MDLLSEHKVALDGLMDLWPDVMSLDPLLIREGGIEAILFTAAIENI